MLRVLETSLRRTADVALLAGISLAPQAALATDRSQHDSIVAAAYVAHAEVGNGEMRPVATQWLAETLVHARRCDEAEAALTQDTAVLEGRIQGAVNAAIEQDDLGCAAKLTRLQLTRPDPLISPASVRTQLKLEGGAVLRAAGHPDGADLIAAAEDELTRNPVSTPEGKKAYEHLWLARFGMHWINEGTALFMPTLEAHARELAADPTLAAPSTVNGFLVVLVGAGRTDLAEAILQSPLSDRDQYRSLSGITAMRPGHGRYDPQPPHCPDVVHTDGPQATMSEIGALDEALDRLIALKNLARQSWLTRCGVQ